MTQTKKEFECIAGKLADVLHVVWSCSVTNFGVMPSADEMKKVLEEYEMEKQFSKHQHVKRI